MLSRAALLGRGAAAFAALAVATTAMARDPYELDVTVGVNSEHFGFSGIEDVVDQLDPDALRDRFAGSNPDSDLIEVDLDFRGLTTSLSFPEDTLLVSDAEAGTLTFILDAAGINEEFEGRGATVKDRREDALDQLEDFLKENKTALKRLLTAFARYSPIDPLAGNPDALMTQRMFGDFRSGFTHKVSQVWACGTTAFNFGDDQPILLAQGPGPVSDIFADAQARAEALRGQNEIGYGVLAQSTTAKTGGGDFKSQYLALPLSYTVKFDGDPGHKLRFDLPLSLTKVEDAESYSLGFGIAYTYPVSDVWSLTPAVNVGATGSADLVAAGGVGGYSLTSAYSWRLGGWGLAMGNSVGRYESLPIKVGDVEAEADIANTVFGNGLLLTGPNALIAKNLVMEYSITDTRLTGDEVYAEYYDEVGVAIGYVDTEMGVIDSFYKLGLSYVMGDRDVDSLKLNLSVRF